MLKTSDFEDYATCKIVASEPCESGTKKLVINNTFCGGEVIITYGISQTFTEHPSKTRESLFYTLATAIDKFNSIN